MEHSREEQIKYIAETSSDDIIKDYTSYKTDYRNYCGFVKQRVEEYELEIRFAAKHNISHIVILPYEMTSNGLLEEVLQYMGYKVTVKTFIDDALRHNKVRAYIVLEK